MKAIRWLFVCLVIIALVKPPTASCQAQTNVPAAISGAKPAGVEHVKIHTLRERRAFPDTDPLER
jgi:hypothetical protein